MTRGARSRPSAAACRSVGLRCFPTDTVYGLATEPDSKEGVRRLYGLKGRVPDKPAAVMFFDLELALAALSELGPNTAKRAEAGPTRCGHGGGCPTRRGAIRSPAGPTPYGSACGCPGWRVRWRRWPRFAGRCSSPAPTARATRTCAGSRTWSPRWPAAWTWRSTAGNAGRHGFHGPSTLATTSGTERTASCARGRCRRTRSRPLSS